MRVTSLVCGPEQGTSHGKGDASDRARQVPTRSWLDTTSRVSSCAVGTDDAMVHGNGRGWVVALGWLTVGGGTVLEPAGLE
ncbi:MAG: hypothetical protein ACJ72I_00210 [Pseudonocardiaceae bacterium]